MRRADAAAPPRPADLAAPIRARTALSPRLRAVLEGLPLTPGIRVLEIGCGPGALARAMAERGGFVLGLDRSATAIAQARAAAADAIAAGRLAFRHAAIEDFALETGEAPFDLAVAIRVGVLDGRHPRQQPRALAAVAAALTPGGRLFIDGGDPLREVPLPARNEESPT